MISATLYSDPACPWAYSENPSLRVIEWRYGSQLQWRLVLVGLTEDAGRYEARGYTPPRRAWAAELPPSLRDAVLARAQAAPERHVARLPGGDRGAAGAARERVGRVPCPSAGELHELAGARRRRAASC